MPTLEAPCETQPDDHCWGSCCARSNKAAAWRPREFWPVVCYSTSPSSSLQFSSRCHIFSLPPTTPPPQARHSLRLSPRGSGAAAALDMSHLFPGQTRISKWASTTGPGCDSTAAAGQTCPMPLTCCQIRLGRGMGRTCELVALIQRRAVAGWRSCCRCQKLSPRGRWDRRIWREGDISTSGPKSHLPA